MPNIRIAAPRVDHRAIEDGVADSTSAVSFNFVRRRSTVSADLSK